MIDEKLRKMAEDMAAKEAANPIPPEHRLRRAFTDAPRDLAAAQKLIADFFKWRAKR